MKRILLLVAINEDGWVEAATLLSIEAKLEPLVSEGQPRAANAWQVKTGIVGGEYCQGLWLL